MTLPAARGLSPGSAHPTPDLGPASLGSLTRLQEVPAGPGWQGEGWVGLLEAFLPLTPANVGQVESRSIHP